MKLILFGLISYATILGALGQSGTFQCSNPAGKVTGWCGSFVKNPDPNSSIDGYVYEMTLANKVKGGFSCVGKNAEHNFCCNSYVKPKKSPQILSKNDATKNLCVIA